MSASTDLTKLPAIGARVRLRVAADRFPHFLAPAGLVGTVVAAHVEHGHRFISVRLDEPLDGAEEWDNCVQWHDSSDDFCVATGDEQGDWEPAEWERFLEVIA